MPRFYCPPPLSLDAGFDLPPDAAHHASRVLRLREGDAVNVFDGKGIERSGVIARISGKHVTLGGMGEVRREPASVLPITLAQAMCSSEKMDWVVQKATELGATRIQPVQTKRSIAKLSGDRADKRVEHWRAVAISACEQCGRNTLPEISAPLSLPEWLAQAREGARYILLPDGAVSLHDQPRPEAATLLIGPEGGFEPDEIRLALDAGFQPVLLGPRVLRTETAALAGITALQTLWGDFR